MRALILSSVLVLALTGCKPIWDPTFMPAGYAHHQKEYKSPPGPKAADIHYEYSAEANEAVMEQWCAAVSDLVMRAAAHDVIIDGTVYLESDLKPGLFRSSFDSALRDELRARGTMLADSPEATTVLFYSAYEPDGGPAHYPDRPLNDDLEPHHDGRFLPHSQTMHLILADLVEGDIGAKASAAYDIPLYGYTPGGYVIGHESPIKLVKQSEEKEQPCYKDKPCYKEEPCDKKDKPCHYDKPCHKEKPCEKGKATYNE